MDANGTVGVAEAAELCGVSDDTIRRRIWVGSLDAVREFEPNGPWRITLSALVAAGLRPHLGGAVSPASAPPPRTAAAFDAHLDSAAIIDELRSEVAEMRARTARAEALAEARAEQAAMLLRLLDARAMSGPQQLSLLTALEGGL